MLGVRWGVRWVWRVLWKEVVFSGEEEEEEEGKGMVRWGSRRSEVIVMRRAKRVGVVRKERNWVWRSGEAVMPDCMVGLLLALLYL